jgi:hypothetical protein
MKCELCSISIRRKRGYGYNGRRLSIVDAARSLIYFAISHDWLCKFLQVLCVCCKLKLNIGWIKFWQFYNSYVLFNLIISNACSEWQVYALSTIFFILFAGNFLTTFKVIRKKYQITNNLHWLKYKYYDWKKLKSPSEKNQ